MENMLEFEDLEVRGDLKVKGDLTVYGRLTISEVKTEYTYKNIPLNKLPVGVRIKVALKALMNKL